MPKLRYKLHWANSSGPNIVYKWVIYDWKHKCPIFYTEKRINGRKICNLLNELNK